MKTIQEYIEDLSKDPGSLNMRVTKDSPAWKDIYLPSQEKKWKENNLSEQEIEISTNSLLLRANLILDIAINCGSRVFAEVGTAEGFQSHVIADHFEWEKDLHAFSCDIRDARHDLLKAISPCCFTFVLGDSSDLRKCIEKVNKKVDLFWVDGSHDKWAVIYDMIHLVQVQSPVAVWIFDDFDSRFGCYEEMNFIASRIGKFARRLQIGTTGSGQPNTLLIVGDV